MTVTSRFDLLENRCFELHSPDGIHNCVLRAPDPSEAAAWFNTLHSALSILTGVAMAQANEVMAPLRISDPVLPGELQQIGWLARKSEVYLQEIKFLWTILTGGYFAARGGDGKMAVGVCGCN
jgi:PH domain